VRTPPGTRWLFDTALHSDFLFWSLQRAAPDVMIRGLLGTPPDLVARADETERARVAAILDGILPVSTRRLGLLNDAEVTTNLTRLALEHVTVPTLTISAADDLYGTYEAARYTAEEIPRARFLGFAEGGHAFVGHDTEVTRAIADFVGVP
jgi:pimeloyl-ACP methyl ester carboxylesterase